MEKTTPMLDTAPIQDAEIISSTKSSGANLVYVGNVKRAIAVTIDSFISFVFFGFLFASIFGGLTDSGFSLEGLPALISLGSCILYFAVLEGTWGTTIGKKVLGLKVVKEDGSKCDMQSALIRNILRCVDYFFLCIIGVYLVHTSPTKQRFGDRVAHTVVVKA